ncbi:MAG: hypothetical protein J6T87_01215, partial [Bacteroidales bacterium]|nr:hypothetical protein [Bacteroidales bacterium]
VTTTLPDRKYITPNADNEPIYIPDAVTYTDYYPFGFPMPRPGFTMGGYRYFFNGQEADNEALGEGALHAFEYRMHDTRIGRFWSVDPLAEKFPWNSAYAFAENQVVEGRELEGLEVVFSTEEFNSAGGIAQYGWNYVRGKGRAYDAFGITFFHYYSTLKISAKETVAGLLPVGIKKHYGIDFGAKSFSQAFSNGSITSLDLAPICRGSVEARDRDWYFGASVGIGIGVVFTTTEAKIRTSYSITYEEQTRLRELIKNKGFEYDDLNPDFNVYQVDGKYYLKYTQHGNWLHPFKKYEIKTSIKMNNVSTPANPQWESEKYQQEEKDKQ